MATMTAERADLINGDMNSPEWIVQNVVIDMAGYWLNDIADAAVIDDELMTYTITLRNDSLLFPYANQTHTLTYKSIWNALGKLARMSVTDIKLRTDIRNAIRQAWFDKDGGDIDAEVAYCIIQFAMFDEIPFG